MKSIKDATQLNNNVLMPNFGLGVYKVEEGQQAIDTVRFAIDAGYRLIDTAAFYENEASVGQAIMESGINRKELFVTTKVWNSDQGYDETLQAFEKSMQKLQLDYLDLYLIHWPVKGKYIDTWRALERLYKEGRVRAIGVSNFQIHHLQEIMQSSEQKPVVNQIELHPYLQQEELRSFCKEYQIAVEAWSPIARGRILSEPVLVALAEKYRKSVAQIILRWHLQNDIIIIPKSVTPVRIKENTQIFDFELTNEDMEKINSLNKNERFGADPDNFNF